MVLLLVQVLLRRQLSIEKRILFKDGLSLSKKILTIRVLRILCRLAKQTIDFSNETFRKLEDFTTANVTGFQESVARLTRQVPFECHLFIP